MNIADSILSRLSRNKVTILNFHKIPYEIESLVPNEPDIHEFIRIVDMVSRLFPIVPLQHALSVIYGGGVKEGCVCLTLDDGYPEWLDTVVPFLKQRNLPATFFITTGQIDGGPLWHERVRHAVGNAQDSCVDITGGLRGDRIRLSSNNDRLVLVASLEKYLKSKQIHERDSLISELENDTGSDFGKIRRISGSQIKLIHESGFEIGAHSVNHPILSQCTEDQARIEIMESKLEIEEITGGKVRYFAYPNGRKSDFNSSHVEYVRQAGFECALTTEPGTLNVHTDKYEIPRFTPWGPSASKLSWQLGRNLLI